MTTASSKRLRIVGAPRRTRMSVPAIDIISAEISFVGNLVGTYNDLAELMTLPAEGRVTLHASAYPLDAINDAMDDLDEGRLHGRGILIP